MSDSFSVHMYETGLTKMNEKNLFLDVRLGASNFTNKSLSCSLKQSLIKAISNAAISILTC